MLALTILMVTAGAQAGEAEPEYDINIPIQDAASALEQLAEQTGAITLFPYDLAVEQATNAVIGRFTLPDALELLLKDTGLSGGLSKKRVVSISAAAAVERTDEGEESMESRRTGFFGALLGGVSGLLGTTAGAQAPVLEEVIVTAQRREQSLQEVPISVEAFTSAEIQRQGYRDLNELGTFSPSVYIDDSRVIEQDQSIRGFGTFGRNLTLEQAVPIFVDGLHFGRAAQINLAFLDPARVEVLKGPQPVFFGMNATAGAFNITSAGPTPEWEGYLDAEVGNFEATTVKGAIGGPLTDRLGIRLAGSYEDGSGHIRDVVTGDRFGAYENVGGRVMLEFTPNDRLGITGKLEYSKIERDSDDPVVLCLTDGTLIYERGQDGTPARPGWQGPGEAIWAPPPQGVSWHQWPDASPLPTNCAEDMGDIGLNAADELVAPPAGVRDEDVVYGRLDPREAAAEWMSRSSNIGRIEDMIQTLESPNGYVELEYQMDNDVQVSWLTGFSLMEHTTASADTLPFMGQIRERSEDFTQYSSELRFTSGPGRIEWMAGVLWQDTDLDLVSNGMRANIQRGLRYNTAWEKQTWKTGFATMTFNFMDDRASLDIGGRYTDLDKTAYLDQVSGSWVYDVNPCDPRDPLTAEVGPDGEIIPGTGNNDPATCALHPEAIQITAADTLFLLPGADVDNLWQMPYRGNRYTPSSWIGGTGVQAVGLTTLVDNEGPDFLGRHNGPYTPENGGNFSSTDFNPQVTFRYRPNDNHSLFVRYAESFKAGGFDTGVQSLPGNVEELRFEPESGWTIEFGSKGNLWDGRARYDATVFQTTFEDFQVQSATGNIENPFIAINAGEQRVRGVEMGLTAAVSDRLTLSLAGALMDGEFTYFPGAGCNEPELRNAETGPCLTEEEADALNAAAGQIVAEAGTIDRTGTQTPKTPDWKLVFGIDWETPVLQGYLLRLNAKGYVSDGFLTDTSGFDPTISMDQHEDLNLTLGIGPRAGPWEVALYGRNLLEAKVTYHPEFDVIDNGIVSQTFSRNAFATYGLKFRYGFFE